MPSINTNAQGCTMTFDSSDWIVGLSKSGSFLGTSGSAIESPALSRGATRQTTINPFLTYGILQPGRGATDVNDYAVLGGVVVAGVLQGGQFAYLVDGGGKVHQYDYTAASTNGLTNGTSGGATFPATITGTTPKGQDIIIYKHQYGGASYFSAFYSYTISTGWNVGALINVTQVGGGSMVFEHTYMTGGGAGAPATPLTTTDTQDATQFGITSVTPTVPHCLEVGADDILYMGSGRYIHAYNGNDGTTNGTVTARVLTLPAGFSITGLKKFQNVLLIAGNYSVDNTSNIGGKAFLYSWNYIDLDVSDIIDLDDAFVSSLFLWKGRPFVITVGEKEGRGANKLKVINGNTPELVSTFDLDTPTNRGVDASSNVLYINCGGKIVQIGDPFTGDISPTNHITNCVSTGTSGWVKNIGASYGMIASSATAYSGGTNSLCECSGQASSNKWCRDALYNSAYNLIPVPPGKTAKLQNIIIENYRGYTLADFNLGIGFNFQGVSQTIFTNKATLTSPLTQQYNMDYLGVALNQGTSIGFQLSWGSGTVTSVPPAISRLTFVFDYINLGGNS